MRQVRIKLLYQSTEGETPVELDAISQVMFGFCKDTAEPFWDYAPSTGLLVVDVPDEVAGCTDFVVVLRTFLGEYRYNVPLPKSSDPNAVFDLGELTLNARAFDFEALDGRTPKDKPKYIFDCHRPGFINPEVAIHSSLETII